MACRTWRWSTGPARARGPFVALLGRTYAPTVSVAAFEAGRRPAVLSEMAEGKTTAGAELAAYVCRNFTCTLPLTSPEALAAELGRAGLLAQHGGGVVGDDDD